MSRLQADALLLLTAIIWGTAFLAQKTGMEGLGPYGFVGYRFLLSFLVVLPVALWEIKRPRADAVTKPRKIHPVWLGLLCISFVAGVILQQVGIKYTSITNAGFLTGLYVVGVPFAAWLLMKRRPGIMVLPFCFIAVLGTWLLNGASLTDFRMGDMLVILCAGSFAVQVVVIGYIVQITQRPFLYSVIQYGVCAFIGLLLAFVYEDISFDLFVRNAPELLYAGLVSGGIAYTLQAVAQQHTPSADAALILASEAVFAAIAGVLLLNERLDMMAWSGCALILLAIVMVEISAYWKHLRLKLLPR
ncbi:MAG: DMT family transporter [Micavibrio sp.]